ncbi:MAG: hypothetical protein R6W84_12500 [Promethearchaeia archaeon]
MQYRKRNRYKTLSILLLFIAGALFIWGIYIFINWSLKSWGGWFLIAVGLTIVGYELFALQNRERFKNKVILEFKSDPNVSVEEIAQKTGIPREDLRDIIFDLRGSGKIKGLFSSKSGHFKSYPVKEVLKNKTKYCPRCGVYTDESSIYCPYCGSEIE